MIRKNNPLIASAILSALALTNSVQAEDESQRYIVKFKQGAKSSIINAVKANRGQIKRELDKHQMMSISLPSKAAQQLKNRSDIDIFEIDPKRYLMAEETPYGITMVEAPQVSDSLTGNMTVCIMDTGYSLGHEDLPSTGVTGDDGYGSYDTGNWYEDGHGHGTHVSGTIAALGNNGVGVIGVNPNNNLKIHMVKVFNNSGSWAYGSDLVAAVDQCTAAGAKVISMSLGGGASSSAEQAAFDNAYASGVLSIAAAGNDGNSSLSYPASYDSVMSVAAVDSSGNKASFSQYNSQVEIAAPGVSVMSTLPNNSYAAWSGTSMATPHVSGVAALVWSHFSSCTAEQVRIAMSKSAEDRGSAGRDNSYGWGIVKAKAMYDLFAANGCDVGELPPPPEPTDLVNGVPVDNLSGGSGDELEYKMDVPSGASNLVFEMSGGSGDADLYVKFGSKPTGSDYDCRPYSSGNNENCSFATPQTGTYYVMVRGYSSFSGVSLLGSYEGGSTSNNPPTSSFTFNCSNLVCSFDGSLSSDSDGSIVSYTWDFGDGNSANGQSVNHTFAATGDYVVTLTVTDNDGANDSSSQTVSVNDGGAGSINLSANGYKIRGRHHVDLSWDGANGSDVDIYRNGSILTTTSNNGAYTDATNNRGGATYTYKVCESGTSDCSSEVSVVF
ncbi:S8 family serine peptidase [Aliikangiella sp. G2MR2-5]|uniref:S8 family serine peptidase n=1 Tax=Aliikangiella sp. G2MR2-5 TaxID=2788943 RepID=UPI0018AACB8C|nr:S8 family serine peptidase [Aliikangiella sp. G2MR2-5]